MRKINMFAAAVTLAAAVTVAVPLGAPIAAWADVATPTTSAPSGTTVPDGPTMPDVTGSPVTEPTTEPTTEPVTEPVTEPGGADMAVSTDTGTGTGTRTPVPVQATLPGMVEPCLDDQPCFNPCTMGVDGTYPPTDPNHWVPGPCDMGTPLPYGRRFVMEFNRLDVTLPGCNHWNRMMSARVTVRVSEPNGTTVPDTTNEAELCAPLNAGVPDVSTVAPGLFRASGRAA